MQKNPKQQSGEPKINRFYELVRLSFERVQKKQKIRLFVSAAVILLAGIVVLGLLEYFLYLPAWFKVSFFLLLTTGAIAVGVYLKREESSYFFSAFYNNISEQYQIPELANAIDLSLQRGAASFLQSAAIKQNVDKLEIPKVRGYLKDFERSQQVSRSLRQALVLFVISALSLVIFAAVQPAPLERLAYAWQNYDPPNPYRYSVSPGSITLEQGDSFTPSIRFDEEKPSELTLAFKTDIEEEYRKRMPAASVNDSIVFSSLSMNSNGSYYFEMDGYRSEVFRADVQLLPRFESLSVTVVPPQYTLLDTVTYRYPFSRVRAYKGSKLELHAVSNKELSTLYLNRKQAGDTLLVPTATQNRYTYSFELSAPDTLSFAMTDTRKLTNKNIFEFVVDPINDEAPFVRLIRPENNLEMKNPEDLLLEYEASDDFGLSSARLNIEIQRAFRKEPVRESLRLPLPALNRSRQFNWELPKLQPKPRDVISYWIEVSDNDEINGSKSSQSRRLTITFPSLTDFVDELENRENNTREQLEDISDSYDRMSQEYDRFKQQLQENPQGNWEQKQSLEEIKKQQQAIDEKVKKLNEEFENIRKDIENSDLLSEESRKAYQELQQLMKEIDDPELAKALEELQKALGNVSQEELRKALENYEFNEQQYQERLKRTVELFKTLKLNSDLDKMAKAFEQLSKEEEELITNEPAPSEQINKQEAIQEDLKNLEQELEELSNNPPQKAREQIEELQSKAKQNLENIRNELNENIEQLKNQPSQNQNSDQLKQQQRQIQQKLNEQAQELRNAQQQMNQQRQQVNVAALQYILNSLINLSENQEDLTKETERLANRSQAFVEKAREEQQISEQFSQVADSLFKVSSEIPSFSNSINQKKNVVQQQLSTAVEQLAERDKSRSTYAERQSLGGINELATMIASLLDQLQNSQGQGGGSGSMTMQQLMEQMQQMSGQQQQLNEQIQNMINDIQGDRLSQDQVERLNQMARQQNEIRKQIEELQRNGGLESGDQVLSELERLSEEMEQTINDLRGGQTDPLMVKRQQNILSRMLNAEKAMQERGEDEKREGTTVDDTPPNVPPDVTIEELQKQIRKLLNDPNRTKFSDDYQRLIEQYFKLLRDVQSERDSTSVN